MRELKVKVGERWYTVGVEEPLGNPAKAIVEGQVILVELEDTPSSAPASRRPSSTNGPSVPQPKPAEPSENLITSPMSGKVIAVRVKPGEKVSSGKEVCVVEAMKMEQSIQAPREGIVKQVHVKPLQQISIGEVLVELE